MNRFVCLRTLLAALAIPGSALGVIVPYNVQATVSGSIGSTTINRFQLRLILNVDSTQIIGNPGSQSTPSVSGSATLGIINPVQGNLITFTLTGPTKISIGGSTLSLTQTGGSTITVPNAGFNSADLRNTTNPINLEGAESPDTLTFATSAGTLTIAAGARFSFHNASDSVLGAGTETFTGTTVNAFSVTNLTRDVDTFLTRLTGRLNGGAPIYDQSFQVAYADPGVQAAINQARAAITSAAGGSAVSFTGPTRTSSTHALAGSTQQTVDGAITETSTTTVSGGPAFIYVGNGEAVSFFVSRGNVNYDLYTTRTTPRTITTTNTYLTSETYVLDGSSTPVTPPTGLRFVSLTPCRLMETRAEYNFQNRVLPFGPPFLNRAETRTFVPQLSTVCSVPNSAKAYVLNVTVIPRGGGVDFVTVYPGGDTRPDFFTVRSPDGLIVANSAIVKAGAGGAISVYASDNTDLLIDIAGYFTDNALESNLVYYPLTPCRVIETRQDYRPQAGPFGPPSMIGKQTRTFRLPQSTDCQIPSGAAAYSVTLTVVPPAALPFLTAWPAGADQPNVSSINSPNGRVLANSVIVPASSNGSINLYAFENTDVIADINGYFAPDNGTGLFYFPVTQCRLANTSDTSLTGSYGPPTLADTTTRTVSVYLSSRCNLTPTSAKAYVLNATVIPGGNPMPFLTVWPTGQAQPNASVINAFQGQTVSSGFIVPAGANNSVDIYAYRRTNVVLEISGYFGR